MTKTQKQKFTRALNAYTESVWKPSLMKTKRLRLYRVVDELIKQGWLGK